MPREGSPISPLLVAEVYESGEAAAFLEMLLSHRGSFKPLLAIVERFKKDRRPWARRVKLDFVLSRFTSPDARVVYKRLFKQAWHDRDHELMGAFMVDRDRAIRRGRGKRYRWLGRGQYEVTEHLRLGPARTERLFSNNTAHYLRRRAWRYFRKLGFADPDAYVRQVADASVRYTDDDVRSGENLLDNWGLMHALFGKSPVLTFAGRHANLSAGRNLAELAASPMFERHWARPESLGVLIDVLLRASCRPVRVWAIQLLRRLHADSLPKLDATELLRLLDHRDPDVAQFAAELLDNAHTVSAFPMPTWMGLLATRNPSVVASIVDTFRRHVSFERVTLAQAVELAARSAVPVAGLGMEILESRSFRTSAEHAGLAKLAGAECGALGGRIARFAVERLNVADVYALEQIVPFFDSRLRTMRGGAFAGLGLGSPAEVDPTFWARLFESPYDDVRAELISRLEARRGSLPGASGESLAGLWRGVLLNIHRGGRAKLTALRQIGEAITREPSNTPALLPIAAIAIRSVRPPEARHGLAAIVSAVERVPSIADDVRHALPELVLDPAGIRPGTGGAA